MSALENKLKPKVERSQQTSCTDDNKITVGHLNLIVDVPVHNFTALGIRGGQMHLKDASDSLIMRYCSHQPQEALALPLAMAVNIVLFAGLD